MQLTRTEEVKGLWSDVINMARGRMRGWCQEIREKDDDPSIEITEADKGPEAIGKSNKDLKTGVLLKKKKKLKNKKKLECLVFKVLKRSSEQH